MCFPCSGRDHLACGEEDQSEVLMLVRKFYLEGCIPVNLPKVKDCGLGLHISVRG